jgi:predicted nucleic acid-binding protein
VSTVKHVLDTSALLAHYFEEPGAEEVDALWSSGGDLPGICSIAIAELRGRLMAECEQQADAVRAGDAYINELTVTLAVDRSVAETAWQLRQVTPKRLPPVDALIAATARAVGATLVHQDPHMGAIPDGVLSQLALPDK